MKSALGRWTVVVVAAIGSFAGTWAFCQVVLGQPTDVATAVAGVVFSVVTLVSGGWAVEAGRKQADEIGTGGGAGKPGQIGASSDPGWETVRSEYLKRVLRRYRRVDMEVLTPLTDQDEYPAVPLPEVFVGQTAKSGPPHIELPRELVLRIANRGVPDSRELPDGFDRAMLTRAREAYEQQPAVDVLQLLAGEATRRLVVFGDPGSGKSTLARYVAYTLADPYPRGGLKPLAGWLPVLIGLREYSQDGSATFLDFLDKLYVDEGLGLPKALLDEYLREDGRVVMIFDGLDEIFDAVTREHVTRQITGFAARYWRAHVVVLSRPIDFHKSVLDTEGFHRYKLQDLDRGKIGEFIRRWYRIACPDDQAEAEAMGARLLAAIDSSRSVAELAGNPMLLTILAIMNRRKTLPRDRTTVYKHAVNVLVEQWEPSKYLARQRPDVAVPYLDFADKLEMLRLIARKMQNSPAGLSGNFISGTDLMEQFVTFLRGRDSNELGVNEARYAAQTMLWQFSERNFILSRIGGDYYGFVHRSFLEYLAAADIVFQFNEEQSLTERGLIEGVFGRRWADPAWHEVLLLVTGMLHERFAAKAIKHLLTADPHWAAGAQVEPHHILLAIRCIGEVRNVAPLAAAARTAVDEVIRVLTVAHRRFTRVFDDSLSRAIEQSVLPVFEAYAGRWPGRERYQEWYIARSAADVDDLATSVTAARLAVSLLGGSAELTAFLQQQAIHGWSDYQRAAAVWAGVARWRDDPTGPDIALDRAISDDSWSVRHTALQALAAYVPSDPRTRTLLRALARRDPHPVIRQAAVLALAKGWRDDPATRDLLTDSARHDDHEGVRAAAVLAVAEGWPQDGTTLELVRDLAIADRHEDVRRTALLAIGRGWPWDRRTPSLLLDRGTDDPSVEVREALIRAVATGWPANPRVLPWLTAQAAAGQDRTVRRAAIEAVIGGWPDDPETAQLVLACVREADAEIKLAAIQAVTPHRRHVAAVADTLRQLALTDGTATVRQAAVRALGESRHDDTMLNWLRERAERDTDPDVRRTAVGLVGEGWPDRPDTELWLHDRAANDEYPDVRRATLRLLAQNWRDDSDTLPLLRRRAETDPDEEVRYTAVRAVADGWRFDDELLRWLRRRAIDDQHPYVREVALQAVVAVGHADPGVYLLLRERVVHDPHELVRATLVWSLADGWAHEPTILALLRGLAVNDRHEIVRRAATQAVGSGWPADEGTWRLLRTQLIGDPREEVRYAAAQTIAAGWHEDPQTLPLLSERAESDPHPAVRAKLITILQPGWPASGETRRLLDSLAANDPDSDVRQTAAEALAAGRLPAQPAAEEPELEAA